MRGAKALYQKDRFIKDAQMLLREFIDTKKQNDKHSKVRLSPLNKTDRVSCVELLLWFCHEESSSGNFNFTEGNAI